MTPICTPIIKPWLDPCRRRRTFCELTPFPDLGSASTSLLPPINAPLTKQMVKREGSLAFFECWHHWKICYTPIKPQQSRQPPCPLAPSLHLISPLTSSSVDVTSPSFASKPQPARHRMIYALLKDDLEREGGIHALQLRTKTPEEVQREEARKASGS